jgi:L-malate glycosyltransferase
LQSHRPDGFKERFKRWSTKRVDWWFAYTQLSCDLVKATGFPDSRITLLNNAVDTSELVRHQRSVTREETKALREALALPNGPVGIFVGSLYGEKRLDFLFSAAQAIRQQIPDFHLLIIGDGQERDKVAAWAAANTWVRWVGAHHGRQKVAYLSLAQIMLNPGLVGLGVLDAFACGVPMLTTDCGIHSPEVAYLENNVNGIITRNDLDAYVQACVHLLREPGTREMLSGGCLVSARNYTIENMTYRYVDGIIAALSMSN